MRKHMQHILLGVQLGQLCCVCSYTFHVIKHKVDLLQGRRHHVDKVVADGLDDGLCCLLFGEASSVWVEICSLTIQLFVCTS